MTTGTIAARSTAMAMVATTAAMPGRIEPEGARPEPRAPFRSQIRSPRSTVEKTATGSDDAMREDGSAVETIGKLGHRCHGVPWRCSGLATVPKRLGFRSPPTALMPRVSTMSRHEPCAGLATTLHRGRHPPWIGTSSGPKRDRSCPRRRRPCTAGTRCRWMSGLGSVSEGTARSAPKPAAASSRRTGRAVRRAWRTGSLCGSSACETDERPERW